MDDDLLCSLSGDAAEPAAIGLKAENIAEVFVLLFGLFLVFLAIENLKAQLLAHLGVQLGALHRFEGNLVRGQLRIVHNGEVLIQINDARLLVESGFQIAVLSECALGSAEDGRLNGFDQHLLLDTLVSTDLLENHIER